MERADFYIAILFYKKNNITQQNEIKTQNYLLVYIIIRIIW